MILTIDIIKLLTSHYAMDNRVKNGLGNHVRMIKRGIRITNTMKLPLMANRNSPFIEHVYQSKF